MTQANHVSGRPTRQNVTFGRSRPWQRQPVEPQYYTVADAVQAFGLSRSTLFALMAANRLTRHKVGKRTLIPAASLHALVAGEAA